MNFYILLIDLVGIKYNGKCAKNNIILLVFVLTNSKTYNEVFCANLSTLISKLKLLQPAIPVIVMIQDIITSIRPKTYNVLKIKLIIKNYKTKK